MLAGLLTEQIEIYSKTVAKNAIGQITPIKTFYKSTYATVTVKSVSSIFKDDSVQTLGITTFTIRYDKGITYNNEIVYEGESYEILTVKKLGRKEGLIIEARVTNI